MTRPQDGALVGQAAAGVELGKLAIQQCAKEGLFYHRVGHAEPLLHEMHPQHRLQHKGRATVLALGVMRRDQLNERGPGNHSLHLGEKHLLAYHSAAQVQIKAGLFHGAKRMSHRPYLHHATKEVLQIFPRDGLQNPFFRFYVSIKSTSYER